MHIRVLYPKVPITFVPFTERGLAQSSGKGRTCSDVNKFFVLTGSDGSWLEQMLSVKVLLSTDYSVCDYMYCTCQPAQTMPGSVVTSATGWLQCSSQFAPAARYSQTLHYWISCPGISEDMVVTHAIEPKTCLDDKLRQTYENGFRSKVTAPIHTQAG